MNIISQPTINQPVYTSKADICIYSPSNIVRINANVISTSGKIEIVAKCVIINATVRGPKVVIYSNGLKITALGCVTGSKELSFLSKSLAPKVGVVGKISPSKINVKKKL